MITKILKTIIFTFIFLTVLTCLPWISWLEIEPRTDFLFSVFSGDYFTHCFGILLAALFFLTIVKWKGWVSIIPLVVIAFIFYINLFLGLFSRPLIWEDRVSYSQLNGDNLIIVQHYWFGITGDNPQYRAIMTKQKSLHENIRPIKFLDDSVVPKCLSSNAWLFPKDSLPEEIELLGDKYILTSK